MKYYVLGESFETCVPWDKIKNLVVSVKARIRDEVKKSGCRYQPFSSMRITQLYENGAAIYTYFGFNMWGMKNPLEAYIKIELAARSEVLACGGNISHHHGRL